MKSNHRLLYKTFVVILCSLIPALVIHAETIHVDVSKGNDAHPGTKEQPLKTLLRAAELVNGSQEGGPTVIKVSPGVYNLAKTVLFKNDRPYTKDERLVIEAEILPDAPEWTHESMPVIIAGGLLEKLGEVDGLIENAGIRVELNHVTMRGLKFLGSPVPRIWYYPIYREGKSLDDLVITQCLFAMENYAVTCNVGILANGHGLVVDHCVFYNCRNPVVFWRVEGGESARNAMRYCIVEGAYTSGVWVCDTAEDFEFHHNIFTRCEYAWMRSSYNKSVYTLNDCIITGNRYYSGVCGANWKLSPTGEDIVYNENNISKEGEIVLERNNGIDVGVPRNFLHPQKESPGSELGAGLFMESSAYQPSFKKSTYVYKNVSGVDIHADVYRPVNNEIVPVVLFLHGGGLILGNRNHLSDLLRNKLIENNYAVVSLDFRLAPETKLEQIIEDVQDACHWVRKKGPELYRIDPGKVVLMGSSSGGYLALITGCHLKEKPRAVITLSGLADLDLLIERENPDKSSFNRDGGPYSIVTDKPVTDGDAVGRMELAQYLGEHGWMLSETLGFDVKEEPARYTKFVLSQNITSDFPPTLAIHAKQDKFVPFAEAEKIQQALNDKKIKNELIVVDEGHSSQIFIKYPEVLDQLGSFLDKYLK